MASQQRSSQSKKTEKKLLDAGYTEGKDYVSKIHLPIVIEHYDLSEGPYCDRYGNSVEGCRGIIGRIEFCGSNNRIIFGNNLKEPEKLSVTLGSNGRLEVGSGCRFEKNFEIQFSGSGGTSQLYIGEKCTFGSGRIIIEADSSVTSVTINRQCTFGDDLLIETGQGNKVDIGRDCMIDRSVSMFCCRRLSVYALSSGLESKDDIFTKCNIFIGDHTAVGTGCRIGKGTTTGSGSIINEYTHTDGHFPNNCLIAGEPAAVIKTDVCWSRKPDGTIEDCHFQYRRKTGELPFSCAGRRVLVISSGEPAGLVLTEELLRVGNTVTLCSTNDSVDIFGTAVRHLIVNAGSLSKVQTMLSKEYFDYVYDTAGLPPEQVSLLVSSVRCSMYILLSSTLVYSDASVSPITEDCFDPMHYQPVNGVDTMWELYRKRETAAFRCTAEKGIDILSVRVPHIVSEREVYLTAIKAAQRASEPGTLYHIKYPVVYVSQLAAFLLFAADSELRGTVNFSDKGIISEDILHKKLCEISMGSIDFTEANIFSSDAFSSMIDTGKAERAFFSVKNTEEWLLPMIEYYSELTLPYDIKYKLPLIK